MTEKMTVEDVNAELALRKLQQREKLLKIIRGRNTWQGTVSVVALTLFALLIIYMEPPQDTASLNLTLIIIIMLIFSQVSDRRFDALTKLLELDNQLSVQPTKTATPVEPQVKAVPTVLESEK